MTRRRWVILALLFVSTILNYVDRQALSILATHVQADLGMSTMEYARVVQAFLAAYIVGYALSGRITDRLGTKLGLALFVGWWSLANMLTGFVNNFMQLIAARAALGLGEAGNYTAAPKAVSEHFPPHERALSVGIYTAGAMVGATLAPPLIGWLAISYGWRMAFIVTGAAGFVWLALWLSLYRPGTQPKSVGERMPIGEIVKDRSVWLLAGGRLVSDPVWYFYLFWFPKYLQEGLGQSLLSIAAWTWIVYLAADIGSVGGGWLSGKLVTRGLAPEQARLRIMGVAALLAPLGMAIGVVSSLPPTLALAAVVTFSHLMFLVNHTSMIVDRFPSHSVGTVMGLMGMASGLGGLLSAEVVGKLVTHGSYTTMFVAMGLLHPTAWLLVRWATRIKRT
jgi:MFS transporter, ACS family, hexuronate transporter